MFSLKIALAALVSYWLGDLASQVILPIPNHLGGLWGAFSSIIVFKREKLETFKSGEIRIFGTFIGTVAGAVCLSFIVNPLIAILIAVFLASFICFFLRLEDYYTPACLAAAVIVILWQDSPKDHFWLFIFSRFIEAIVGVLVAFAVLHIPPTKVRRA